MQISSWMSAPGGRLVVPITLSSYSGCLHMLRKQGRRKYPELNAKVEVPTVQLVGLNLLETKSGNSIMMFIN